MTEVVWFGSGTSWSEVIPDSVVLVAGRVGALWAATIEAVVHAIVQVHGYPLLLLQLPD